jgi:hypothetical protein
VPAPAIEFMTPAINAATTTSASLSGGNVADGNGPVDCVARETQDARAIHSGRT